MEIWRPQTSVFYSSVNILRYCNAQRQLIPIALGKAAGFDCVTKPREPGKVRMKSAFLWNQIYCKKEPHFQFSRGTHLGLDRAIEELSLLTQSFPTSRELVEFIFRVYLWMDSPWWSLHSRPSLLLDRYLLRPSHNGAWRLHLAERSGRSSWQIQPTNLTPEGSGRFKRAFCVLPWMYAWDDTWDTAVHNSQSEGLSFDVKMSMESRVNVPSRSFKALTIGFQSLTFRLGRCAWPEGRSTVQWWWSRDWPWMAREFYHIYLAGEEKGIAWILTPHNYKHIMHIYMYSQCTVCTVCIQYVHTLVSYMVWFW